MFSCGTFCDKNGWGEWKQALIVLFQDIIIHIVSSPFTHFMLFSPVSQLTARIFWNYLILLKGASKQNWLTASPVYQNCVMLRYILWTNGLIKYWQLWNIKLFGNPLQYSLFVTSTVLMNETWTFTLLD